MTALLYIILGAVLGVGLTLLILQDRFVRQRRLLVAMGESERAKSSQMLHELDDQWKQESRQFRQKLKSYKNKLSIKQVAPQEALSRVAILKEKMREKEEARLELEEAKNNLQNSLSDRRLEISEMQEEISFLKGEADRLSNEAEVARKSEARAAQAAKEAEEKAKRLALTPTKDAVSDKRSKAPSDKSAVLPGNDFGEDFLVFRPGKGRHLLPGKVARAFMNSD